MDELFFRKLPLVNSDKLALVDDDYDGEWLGYFNWRLDPNGYVSSTTWPDALKPSTRYLHRLAYGSSFIPDGWKVVHKNGDRLDNRSSNLICLSGSEAMLTRRPQRKTQNSHGFRGVNVQHNRAGDREYIYALCKWKFLKNPKTGGIRFETLGEAARAYDRAAWGHWGTMAQLNFPKEQPRTAKQQ